MLNRLNKIKYPTETQLEFWKLKRDRLSGKEIAARKAISPAAVSQTLTKANKRIQGLIENAARTNRISIDRFSAELGVARGRSHVLKLKTFITYSPINGVLIWYEHEGDCNECEENGLCRKLLVQEFKERDLEIPGGDLQPTDLGDELFKRMEELFE